MATPLLKRSHAVVWLPPRSVGERAFAGEARLLVMRARDGGADSGISCERTSLDALPKLKSISVVFDARDVTLVSATLPPLSPAKLLRALPNAVEDQLLSDVQACALALGPAQPDGRRVVAAVDRGWMEFVLGAFERRGITVTGAWPAQLALPAPEGGWALLCVNDGVAIRTGDSDGFGWSAGGEQALRSEALVAVVEQAALAGKPQGELIVYAEDPEWQAPLDAAVARFGLPARLVGLPVPKAAPVELLDARGGSAGRRWLRTVDWRAWRMPAMLAAACAVVALVGLNLHWNALMRERDQLKQQAEDRFRQAFPNTPVIVDPVLQMQRTLSDLRARTGQSGPEDFVPLVARLAQALGGRASDALAALDYRDGALKLRFQPSYVEGRANRDAIRDACQRAGLKLAFDGEREPTATVSVLR